VQSPVLAFAGCEQTFQVISIKGRDAAPGMTSRPDACRTSFAIV
jgi:hypothetical protein